MAVQTKRIQSDWFISYCTEKDVGVGYQTD